MEFLNEKQCAFYGYLSHPALELSEGGKTPFGKVPFTFTLKPGNRPSLVLDDLDKRLNLVNPELAVSIATHKALRDLFGSQKFDCLFAHFPMKLGSSLDYPEFLFRKKQLAHKGEFERGDIVTFENVFTYPFKHPLKDKIYHVVYGGKDTYFGFGLPPEGLSQTEIEDTMLDDYNQSQNTPFLDEAHQNHRLKMGMPADKKEVAIKRRQMLMIQLKAHQLTKSDFQSIPRLTALPRSETGKCDFLITRLDVPHTKICEEADFRAFKACIDSEKFFL